MSLGISKIAANRTVPFKGAIFFDNTIICENELAKYDDDEPPGYFIGLCIKAPNKGSAIASGSNKDMTGVLYAPEHKQYEDEAIEYLKKIGCTEGSHYQHIEENISKTRFEKLMQKPLYEISFINDFTPPA